MIRKFVLNVRYRIAEAFLSLSYQLSGLKPIMGGMPSWTPNDYDKVVQTLTPAPAAAVAIDVYQGSMVIIQMPAGNISLLAPLNAHAGDILTVKTIQDGVGSRTISAVASNIKRIGGALALTATAAATDMFSMRFDGTNWYVMGAAALALA